MEPAPNPHKGLHYAQLDQHTKEIRLMILDHGEAGAGISCRLIHTTLKNHPAYKALSYSWGEVKVLYTIDIDGYVFGIGPNLRAALQSIRHPKKPTYLWVDAICINQKDIAERNYQVTIMHGIYQEAFQVIVWLGKKSFDSDHAMDVLEDKKFKRRVDLFPPSKDDSTAVTYTATAMATWKALSNFYTRSWWDRIWVMQEVVWAARDVTVMCGSRELSWKTLFQNSFPGHLVAISSTNMTENTVAAIARSSFVHELTNIRAKRIKALSVSLLQLLSKVRIRQSTDPRDRVFGILNLIPLEEWPCKPDYSKDVVQIFAEVARSIIEKYRTLSLLATCEHPWLPIGQESHLRKTSKLTKVPGLPSWTPNWAAPRLSVPLCGGYDYAQPSSPTLFGELATEFVFSDDMTTLSVRGFTSDVVTISVGPFTTRQIDACRPGLYKRLENIAFRTKPGSAIYTGHMTRLEAYCRTLVLDHPRNGSSFDSSAMLQYLQWSNGSREQLPDFLSAQSVTHACASRFFFCSSRGYMGFGPQGTVAGDLLCIIYGSHVPLVLRKRPAYYLARGGSCVEHEDFRTCMLSGCSNEITSWEEIKEHFIVIGEACESP